MRLTIFLVIAAITLFGAYLAMFSSGTLTPDVAVEETESSIPETSTRLNESPEVELVGHNDLFSRGMNSSLAVAGDYVYVGSRTEGDTHANAGVLIIDASDPANPQIVGQIGPPYEALYGISSRELRAVEDKDLLIVMNFSCSTQIHDCSRNESRFPDTGGVAEGDNLKFYDISDRDSPRLINTYFFGTYPGSGVPAKPHEFYLWRDPVDSDRILLYVSTPIGPPSIEVLDISDPLNVELIATWDGREDAGLEEQPSPDSAYLHSLALSDDGRMAYLAYQGAGFFAVDTSEIAENLDTPQIHPLTPIANRVDYTPPHPAGNHTAVKIPNRDLVITTDEIYPTPLLQGCPWGWMRIIDISDSDNPFIASEYKLPENESASCPADRGPEGVTYTSHNPTVTENLVVVTWHAGGLQFVDISDPENPQQIIEYSPAPLPRVATEDPALGGHGVAMWSYPVFKDGLIYVVDIRNGLYILRYSGPYNDEINSYRFREGNSNLN